MPFKKPCKVLGCGHDATHGKNGMCRQHARAFAKLAPPAPTRPNAHQRGYTHKWRELRDKFLRSNPLCAKCGRGGEDVDHIIPIRSGGTHQWKNLQTLCRPCHRIKTEEDKNKFKEYKKND